MPASSSIVLRPLWSSLPWIRFAAVAELVDGLLQAVLDLLVGRGPHRGRGQVPSAEQLRVDVARGA